MRQHRNAMVAKPVGQIQVGLHRGRTVVAHQQDQRVFQLAACAERFNQAADGRVQFPERSPYRWRLRPVLMRIAIHGGELGKDETRQTARCSDEMARDRVVRRLMPLREVRDHSPELA
jgi:hypothetical protein